MGEPLNVYCKMRNVMLKDLYLMKFWYGKASSF